MWEKFVFWNQAKGISFVSSIHQYELILQVAWLKDWNVYTLLEQKMNTSMIEQQSKLWSNNNMIDAVRMFI